MSGPAPFVRGRRDCATLAADHYLAITGRDPMADLRGSYDSATAAARLLRAEGGFVSALDRRLAPWVRVAEADGAIALIQERPEPVLAVRAGGWWRTIGPSGAETMIRVGERAPAACWGPSNGC